MCCFRIGASHKMMQGWPCPQNSILVPIRGSFKISGEHLALLLDGSPCELLMISLHGITRQAKSSLHLSICLGPSP